MIPNTAEPQKNHTALETIAALHDDLLTYDGSEIYCLRTHIYL